MCKVGRQKIRWVRVWFLEQITRWHDKETERQTNSERQTARDRHTDRQIQFNSISCYAVGLHTLQLRQPQLWKNLESKPWRIEKRREIFFLCCDNEAAPKCPPISFRVHVCIAVRHSRYDITSVLVWQFLRMGSLEAASATGRDLTTWLNRREKVPTSNVCQSGERGEYCRRNPLCSLLKSWSRRSLSQAFVKPHQDGEAIQKHTIARRG